MKVMVAFCLVIVVTLPSHTTEECLSTKQICKKDIHCCTMSCGETHMGAPTTCQPSRLGDPCATTADCQGTLECLVGANSTCCAPIWDICFSELDCCNNTHVCRKYEYLHYKRCQELASSAPPVHWNGATALAVLFLAARVTWGARAGG